MSEQTWVSDNGQVQLYHGDCLEILPTLEAGSVDAVITDPPWNCGHFGNDDKLWPEYTTWLEQVRDDCVRVARYGVWIFQSTKAIPYVSRLFEGWQVFASAKNFCQMMRAKVPNAWDIAYFRADKGYRGNGRNWHVGNTAGMLKERTAHPTPRPLDTMVYILEMFDWQTILDPFIGSGTTAVACVKTGRRCIGIEIDAGYFEIAKQRTIEALMQPRLEGI